MTVTRFAPSPTGELHLGHAYAAKVAHGLAREAGGKFLLRQEDIDTPRVRAEHYRKIEEDLQWLGLGWDGEVLRQSVRQEAYAEALETLKRMGLVYPCFCTRKDILTKVETMRSAPHGNIALPYPGICRGLPEAETTERIEAGGTHSWRFHSRKAAAIHGVISFEDLRHGHSPVDVMVNGDVVLARKDIGISYHLAVVVDDEFQQVTHVTRAVDLYGATHVHRQLQSILGYREPTYLHHECVCDETGKRLAKRDEARSIRSLRENGHTPEQVLAMAQP